MIKKSIVECSGCGESFEKQTKYIKQSENRGMKHYCSRSCMAKHDGVRKLPGQIWNKSVENKSHLKTICSNRKDEYTDFKTLYRSAKKRGKEFDLDLPYLKELWESQNGKCVITGVDLNLSSCGNKNYQASLDRIDSNKGYIKGNVRYTSVSINWLKSNFDDNHLYEFMDICRNSVK